MHRQRNDSQQKPQSVFPTHVQVGGSSRFGGLFSVRPEETERSVEVLPEVHVQQDTRSSIVDMEIGPLKLTSTVRKLPAVSLDADKREVQKVARNNAEYHFRGQASGSARFSD